MKYIRWNNPYAKGAPRYAPLFIPSQPPWRCHPWGQCRSHFPRRQTSLDLHWEQTENQTCHGTMELEPGCWKRWSNDSNVNYKWIICGILLTPRCCEQSRLDYHAPTRHAVINLDFPRSARIPHWRIRIWRRTGLSDCEALKDSQEDSRKTRELSKTIQNSSSFASQLWRRTNSSNLKFSSNRTETRLRPSEAFWGPRVVRMRRSPMHFALLAHVHRHLTCWVLGTSGHQPAG